MTGLDVDQVPRPSGADPNRNRHRDQVGWQIPTVRAMVGNARYTGYEVWGTFAKSEDLIDPSDPTSGYQTRLVLSGQRPVRSRDQAHEAIVDISPWSRANQFAERSGRRGEPTRHARPDSRPAGADDARGGRPTDAGAPIGFGALTRSRRRATGAGHTTSRRG